MRIKDLFTVPTGQKVTEKHLRRVLVSSVCSILLCMCCLVGTTWAWFTVSVESKENEIQIATVSADVTITQGENTIEKSNDGNYSLTAGQYDMHVKLNNNATEAKAPVYMVISVVRSDEPADHYYVVFEKGINGAKKELSLGITGESALVSFCVSWVKPVSAELVEDEATVIGELPTEPPTEETTVPEENTDPTVPETSEGDTQQGTDTGNQGDESGSGTGPGAENETTETTPAGTETKPTETTPQLEESGQNSTESES